MIEAIIITVERDIQSMEYADIFFKSKRINIANKRTDNATKTITNLYFGTRKNPITENKRDKIHAVNNGRFSNMFISATSS